MTEPTPDPKLDTTFNLGEFVRRHDPDRFLTSLFAPAAKRPALWLLYAFNHELARAREIVREPMMGLIRLQWWREVVEGARRRHEIADPLRDALDAGTLSAPDLLELIEAREADPPETEADWPDYVDGTAGGLATVAARVLAETDTASARVVRAAGAAYGAAGVLRNRALAGEPAPGSLRAAGKGWLAIVQRERVPRPVLAAALPAALAGRDLARRAPVRERGLGDKLAVFGAALTGRI